MSSSDEHDDDLQLTTSEAIDEHIREHLIAGDTDPGSEFLVYCDMLPAPLNIDLLVLPAGGERAFPMIITSGMSALPMQVPEGLEAYRHAELILTLPDDWPIDQQAWIEDEERNYWPMRWLKQIARLPHEYETFLIPGHTVPNGDPPEALADGTRLCGWMLGLPNLVPNEFSQLEMSDGRTIFFYSVVPLYPEEMDYKLKHGPEALFERFQNENILYDLLLMDRKSAIS